MKRTTSPIRRILSALIITTLLASFAAPSVSSAELPGGAVITPALSHIAAARTLIKSSLTDNPVIFCCGDFDALIGSEVSSVTVLSLPSAESGALFRNDIPVSRGEVVRREDIGELSFVPASGSTGNSSFRFGAVGNQAYSMTCVLFTLPQLNLAPTASVLPGGGSIEASVYSSLTYYGSLRVADPEEDPLSYRIASYPSHGCVRIVSASAGSFTYTPDTAYTGTDRFTFIGIDKYGNCSEEVPVSLRVTERGTADVYTDLDGCWAENAALTVCDKGIMTGTAVGDKFVFEPYRNVSRSEFLVMAMNAAGIKPASDIPDNAEAVLSDVADIPSYHRAYVSTALECGIIGGCGENEYGAAFEPQRDITRAEAAVILRACLEKSLGEADMPACRMSFTDGTSIPAWASDAMGLLAALGVLNGDDSGCALPGKCLTRAAAAQIMLRTVECTAD